MKLQFFLLPAAVLTFCVVGSVAHAGQVPNPANVDTPMTSGNCVQANGPQSIVSTSAPCGSGGSTTPGGSNTQVQYNNSGAFGGVPTLVYNGTQIFESGAQITGSTILGVLSTGSGSFDLRIGNNENLTANRTFNLDTGDASRSMALGGNFTTAGGNVTLNVTSSASVTIPATGSSTMVDTSTAQTLTNKTLSGSSNTLSNIANSSLTNSSLSIAGNSVALGASLSATTLTASLNSFSSSLAGLAPASGGGTTNYLRADGTWAAPSGAGTVTSVGSGAGLTGGPITGTGSLSLDLTHANTWTGVQSFTDGDLSLLGASSGNAILKAPATGGGTVTLPSGTATLASLSNNLGAFSTTTSAQLASVISDESGTGALLFATNPVLTTPNLGTPSFLTLTNATGLPISTGVGGLGSGIATFLATPSSTNLFTAVTGQTGSGGGLVFATGPTLSAPTLNGNTTFSSMASTAGNGFLTMGGIVPLFQQASASANGGNGLLRFSVANNAPATFVIGRSGQATVGAFGAVTTAMSYSSIQTVADDGTTYNSLTSEIRTIGLSGATISTGVVPGQMLLRTANSSGTMTTNVTLDSTNGVVVAGTLTGGASIQTSSNSSKIGWTTRSEIGSNADGSLLFTNNAVTGFTTLQLGGTTSSFGGLKTNGTETDSELADASGVADFGFKSLVSRGSTPTLSGTCTTASQTGGNTAGTFTATCTAQTVIITFATTAPNGWNCNAHDQTTPADALSQSASSATTCTLSGTTVALDRISFDARAF